MARPAPDLLARPAVCGHPAGMILTRAPSRAPFTSAVKITPGPQTCSRAPVGSPASALRFDHRLALAFASGWFVHRTNHRQAAVTGAAIASRQKTHAAETFPPHPRFFPRGRFAALRVGWICGIMSNIGVACSMRDSKHIESIWERRCSI